MRILRNNHHLHQIRSLVFGALGDETLDNVHACLAQISNLANQLILLVHCDNVISSSDADSVDHDVGDCPSACLLEEGVLDSRADGVLIELDDVGIGCN